MRTSNRVLRVGLLWASAVVAISLAHVELNRGGLRAAFRPAPQRLTVGHLPVT